MTNRDQTTRAFMGVGIVLVAGLGLKHAHHIRVERKNRKKIAELLGCLSNTHGYLIRIIEDPSLTTKDLVLAMHEEATFLNLVRDHLLS